MRCDGRGCRAQRLAEHLTECGHTLSAPDSAEVKQRLRANTESAIAAGVFAHAAAARANRKTVEQHRETPLQYFGIGQARRGWLETKDVLNTRPLSEVRRLLKR